jgi:hypothetical protein
VSAGSIPLQVAFVALALALAAGFVAAVRRALPSAVPSAALGTALWMAVTYLLARLGLLRFSPFPPTMVIVILATILLAIGLGSSKLGARLAAALPLWLLVGFQGFRIAVEAMLHRAYREGLLPVQMTYEGANFDAVTGITAVLLGAALAIREVPRWVVLGWNLLGLALVTNAVGIAVLSAPTPFRRFPGAPSTELVTAAPWVWLPAVMVLAALLGHVLVFRRLAAESGRRPA